MSRAYSMTVQISGHKPNRVDAIKQAAAEAWPFESDDWWPAGDEENSLCASGDGRLCGGETEEVFSERLAVAIWKANRACCNVIVDATYLEELPYSTHCLGEDDYARMIAGSKSQERSQPR
ncbi:MAG: hypothetical protein GXY83_20850 [Rhodopirellula sp.]|nr:hypothetical protein [Rhodopirellula sp.]